MVRAVLGQWQEQCWPSGERSVGPVVRTCALHQWVRFESDLDAIRGLTLLVLYSAIRGFSLGALILRSSVTHALQLQYKHKEMSSNHSAGDRLSFDFMVDLLTLIPFGCTFNFLYNSGHTDLYRIA